tara:strand:- start:249 stop:566 length:318 start_codon:yes stop_codon:yes gene_type:complete
MGLIKVDNQPSQKEVFEKTESFIKFVNELGLKGEYEKCCVCGWNKTAVDMAHILPKRKGGKVEASNISPLCPNHHREFDKNVISHEAKVVIYQWILNILPKFEKN